MRKRIAHGLALFLCIAGLGAAQGNSGSAHDRGSPPRQPKPATKSTVAKKRTRPYQVGTASWYGSYFHGKETASGEAFNMYDLTAAHPTLPLGTYVKVTNLRNGRAVVVRVNDRGPVVDGRIIDLSYEAARVLHLEHQGIQQVRLDLVSEPQTVAMLRPVARLQ
jgi:rare lipoprotein A (peptidoglycan hydrolase)